MTGHLVGVHLLGKDRIGLIADVSGTISERHGNIVRVEETSIEGVMVMFMVVDLLYARNAAESRRLASRLKRALEKKGVKATLSPMPQAELTHDDGRRPVVVTILGADKVGVMHAITGTIAKRGLNIERMRHVAQGDFMAFEIVVEAKTSELDGLRSALRSTCEEIGVDAVIQPDSIYRTRRRLVVFDMDSTIVEGEMINELARSAGAESAAKEITDRAMEGKMDFKAALKARVRLLRGMPVAEVERIAEKVKLQPGSRELLRTLKAMGFRTALVSGGFSMFTDRIRDDLGFDHAYSNRLVVRNGRLTGEVAGDIIDSVKKWEIVDALAAREGLSHDEIVAVGDGANDRIMVKNAGLGIAFNAKDVLKRVAHGSISRENLAGLLFALGATDADIERFKAAGKKHAPRAKRPGHPVGKKATKPDRSKRNARREGRTP
ncbi:MAG: phosphoserine phosphatase SerB [Euryarchaeota archaeon]|nr:phosphoserine phosphatase SerB [Euryarchaeota archaeon]